MSEDYDSENIRINPAEHCFDILWQVPPQEWFDGIGNDRDIARELFDPSVQNLQPVEDYTKPFLNRMVSHVGLYDNVDPIAVFSANRNGEVSKVVKSYQLAMRESVLERPGAKAYDYVYNNRCDDGTNVVDLGGGDGRKAVAGANRRLKKDDPQAPTYIGAPVLVVDKVCTKDKPLQGMNPGGVEFLKMDLAIEKPDFGEDKFLVSTMFLTNIPLDYAGHHLWNKDGLHLVPDLEELIKRGVSHVDKNNRVQTSILLDGKEHVHQEYYNTFDLYKPDFLPPGYGYVVTFQDRVITTGDVHATYQSPDPGFQRPDRLTTAPTAAFDMEGPFKLKYDGEEARLTLRPEGVTLYSMGLTTEFKVGIDYDCPITVIMDGELMLDGERDTFIPHKLFLAGRMIPMTQFSKFWERTKFDMDNLDIYPPPLFNTLFEACVHKYESEFSSDGISALGWRNGVGLVAKPIETMDIRIRNEQCIADIIEHVAPRELLIDGTPVDEFDFGKITLREVREYYAHQPRGIHQNISFLRKRPANKQPNQKKRILSMLESGDGMYKPVRLQNFLTLDQKLILAKLGPSDEWMFNKIQY